MVRRGQFSATQPAPRAPCTAKDFAPAQMYETIRSPIVACTVDHL
jgi:hypothetical protein